MLASALQLALQNSFMNSYVFAFTDSNAQAELAATASLLGLAETTRAMINIVTTSSPLCGAASSRTGIEPAIEEIISYSGGDIYNTDDTGNFMKFIPTFYDSGLTFINDQDDCSSKNLTIYFPIDGWTQSFTTAIYGNTPTLTIYLPNGKTTYYAQYDVPFIDPSPTTPNLLLRQTVIPCDNIDWTTRDAYCYILEGTARTWTSARDYCHGSQMMSFLVDVHSNDTQNFIELQTGSADYWIGLNSLKTQGQWEWDVPDGAAYSHLDGYTNWAPGEPANDPNLRCVQVRHSGTNVGLWYATDCTQTLPFACQKHRYGQGLSPGELDVNLLPQGMWRADISTASGSCYVQVRAQSQIQPYYGFVQDIHSDQPDQYGIFNSQSNRLAATVTGLSAINANSPSGTVNYAFMYKGNFSMNRAVTFEQRALCAYQFVSQPFTCPGQNINPNFVIDDFFIKFSGVDQFGNLYERFSPAYCLKQVIANCNNGGTQYQGVCICPPYFTGPTCSVRVCQNGGGLSSDGTTCTCRTGFTGGSCEFPLCLPPYPATFHNNGKTLAIVLETSYSTGAAVFRLRRNLNAVLNQVLNVTASTWFSNFILYPFDSTTNMANWYAPGVYTTVDALTNAFMNITPSQCPGAAACSSSCPRPIMTALNATLNYPDLATPNSQVLIITQSSPEDNAVVDQVLTQIQQTGVKG
uniref:Uncharacterized protein n=1 Tax=Plectus sambesii TaxID=2011161 RepID=A0A914XME4_9BILA